MKIGEQFRQGDVFITRVHGTKKVGKDIDPISNRFPLAFGEVTGHSHSVAVADCDWLTEDEGGTLWLKVKEQTPVEHLHNFLAPSGDHGSITLEPGTYKINRQREFRRGDIRQVMD